MGWEQEVPVQVQNKPVYKRFIEETPVGAYSLNQNDLYMIVRNTGAFPVMYGYYLGPDAEMSNIVRFSLLSDNPGNPPSTGMFSIPEYTFFKIKDDVSEDTVRSLVGHSTGPLLGGRRKRKSSRKYKHKYTQRKNKGKRKSRRVKRFSK